MNNLSLKYDTNDVHIQYAWVKTLDADGYWAETDTGLIRAQRAAGCLIEPQPGDQVLVAENPPGQGFILTVLIRQQTGPAPLTAPDGLLIDAGDHPLTLKSNDLTLLGTNNLTMAAPDVHLQAARGSVDVAHLDYWGEKVRARVNQIKSIFSSMETTAGRVLQRFNRLYRRVDDVEDAQCGRLRLSIKRSLRMKSQTASLNAEKSIDLDADKIRLG